MTKYAYEYGKRWLACVPRGTIGYFVDKQHVSRPIEDIQADIIVAIERQKKKTQGYTDAVRRQCLAYAAIRHDRNRDLYRRVMSGKI